MSDTAADEEFDAALNLKLIRQSHNESILSKVDNELAAHSLTLMGRTSHHAGQAMHEVLLFSTM